MGVLSWMYGQLIARRNQRYDSGRAAVERASLPVISVGNVSTGGTGKTPMVHAIARMLLDEGHRPAILLRGYGRLSRGVQLVSDGSKIRMDVHRAGDEAMLHAYTLRVPVIVSEKRIEGARLIARRTDATVIILDDGFQHRSIYRDLDVVLVNESSIADQRLLPEGRLREPLTSLSRADVVILTQNGVSERDVQPMMNASSILLRTRANVGSPYTLVSIIDIQRNVQLQPRVVAVTSIAHPERFRVTLETMASQTSIVRHMEFQDHHLYRKGDVHKMIEVARNENVEMIVTTEKDAVKLLEFAEEFVVGGVQVAVLPLRLQFLHGGNEFKQLLLERISR